MDTNKRTNMKYKRATIKERKKNKQLELKVKELKKKVKKLQDEKLKYQKNAYDFFTGISNLRRKTLCKYDGEENSFLKIYQDLHKLLFEIPIPIGDEDSLPLIKQSLITFPIHESPTATIIIPVFGKLSYTLRCLTSLISQKCTTPFEVIVIDDSSPDNTSEFLKTINGIRIISNQTNIGFLRSCNLAAKKAKGEFLVFLNNDTEVLDGWLESLLNTYKQYPNAGLVGSKLVYADGRLQEAGGLIWRDASGWNFGHLEDPKRPEYNYVRDVDYCSGASIAIKRELFFQLGAFDEKYCPAYYEDTDLAFKVKEAGYRVLYQPKSTVLHYEGITSGTDIEKGVKAYQQVNKEKFHSSWQKRLKAHRNAGELPYLERDRTANKRILIIDALTPTPDRDSGSVDAYYTQKLFIDLGYKVVFIPESLVKYMHYTENLQQLGIECIYRPYIESIKDYLREHGQYFDLVMLYRAWTAERYIDDVKRYCPQAKVIFNTVDLHYLRAQRKAELTESKKDFDYAEATKNVEFSLMKKADVSIIISKAEIEMLQKEDNSLSLTYVPLIREIPGNNNSFRRRKDIVFIGGFQHTPNVDGILYFADKIWPMVQYALPDVQLKILGSRMPEEVANLGKKKGIDAVGYVEDLSEYFDTCRVSIAPLRYGAGLKGKIAGSGSYGVPSVASVIAAEGMGLKDGKEIFIGVNENDFAEKLVTLYTHEHIWNSMSSGVLQYVKNNYSVNAAKNYMSKMLQKIGM